MIHLGQYLPGDTAVHRLDPRVKTLSVVALSMMVFAATWPEILLVSLFLLAVIGTVRMTPLQALGALRPVAVFMAMIFLVHLLFSEGEAILTLDPLPLRITREGLSRGIYVTWQFSCLILAAAVLTRSTSPSDLVGGIERLLRPLSRIGIPSQDLAMMIAMALRFMPMLLEEYDRLRMAQMARGADFTTGSLALRTRAVASLAVPLLLSAFRRADELAVAMEARGYRRGPRTTLRELVFSRYDLGVFAAMTAFFLANFALRMAVR
jgi:energy-coupling factor transporter transmembrane protein EcfT